MKSWSCAGRLPHGSGLGGAGVIETSACAPSHAPAQDADPAWELWQKLQEQGFSLANCLLWSPGDSAVAF